MKPNTIFLKLNTLTLIFFITINTTSAQVKLSIDSVNVYEYKISNDRVIYKASNKTYIELYSVPITGGISTKLSDAGRVYKYSKTLIKIYLFIL